MKVNNIQKRFNNVATSKTFKIIRNYFNFETKKVLDLGCGYGEYLSLCGKGSLGITSTPSEVKLARSKGLNVFYGNVEELEVLKIEQVFDVIWANNLFEHLLSPHSFLIKLKKISNKNTVLILGVPVIPKINFLLNFKKFRGSLASNHINFFSINCLKLTVERSGWDIIKVSPFFVKFFCLDWLWNLFSPHVYIIAHNNRNFVYPSKKIKEWGSDPYYKNLFKIVKIKK